MKAGIIFLISVINTISYFGKDDFCNRCCEGCCCEGCWKGKEKKENEEDKKENEEEKKENEEEKKSEEGRETFFLEVKEGSENEAEDLVSGGWLEEKNENKPVLKLLKKIEGDSTENNIKVVKYKDGNFGVENLGNLREILGINTKKWALFEIMTVNKEIRYLYCSDIESVKNVDKIIASKGIFEEQKNLLRISVLDCDTSGVTNMDLMFSNCDSLTTLNISKFNTSKMNVISMFFWSCNQIQQIITNKNCNSLLNCIEITFSENYNKKIEGDCIIYTIKN